MELIFLFITTFLLISLMLPVFFGLFEFFEGTKYLHKKRTKEDLLISYLKLIKEGHIIQGFPHNGWSVSYYPSSNDKWFYPRIYSYFYKWSVYYRFKWCDRC
jgi:hypothetical protein